MSTETAKTPWFRPRLIPHARWEMLLMRLILAWFIWASVAEVNLNLTEQPKPNGLAAWGLDFTFWANDGLRLGLLAGLGIAAALYASGWLMLPALAYILFAMITAGTLANSQGSIGHSTQLLCMCLLAEFLVLLWLRLRPIEPQRPSSGWLSPVPVPHEQWAVHAMKYVIAAGYVSTGLCKVLATKGLWIWQTPLLVVQLKKGNLAEYYDSLKPGDTFFTETIPQLILAHPMLARVVFGTALILELAALLALLGRGWSLGVGLALIAMHLSISVVMSLDFEYHLVVLFALLVNLPYWASLPFQNKLKTSS
jgi:hypothetical protein